MVGHGTCGVGLSANSANYLHIFYAIEIKVEICLAYVLTYGYFSGRTLGMAWVGSGIGMKKHKLVIIYLP